MQQHLLKREYPPGTERISLTKECGWKDGDRGGPARMQGIHRKERESRERKTFLTHTGLLMEGVRKLSAENPWYTKHSDMLGIGYRKWSTSMMSLFPSPCCVKRIQRPSGDTAKPATCSLSELKI